MAQTEQVLCNQNSGMDCIFKQIICPIRHVVPEDPVLAGDGYIYSAQALEMWLAQRNTSPMTGQPMHANDNRDSSVLLNICNAIRAQTIVPNPSLAAAPMRLVNLGKERELLRALITRIALDADGIVFGSSCYNKFIYEADLLAFYVEVRKERVAPDIVFNDQSFHNVSWNARQRRMRDVDLYFAQNAQLELFTERLKVAMSKGRQLHKIRRGEPLAPKRHPPKSGYLNSTFLDVHELRCYQVHQAIGYRSTVSLSIDLVVPKRSGSGEGSQTLTMGPFPNVIKTICMSKTRYFLRTCPSLPPEHMQCVLQACAEMFRDNATVTTEALLPGPRPNLRLSSRRMEHWKDDLSLYADHLWKEVTSGVKILNLSISKGDNTNEEDGAAYQDCEERCSCVIFDCENTRTSRVRQLTLAEVQGFITESLFDDLRQGKIACGDLDYIHVFNDPDFDIGQTPYTTLQWIRHECP